MADQPDSSLDLKSFAALGPELATIFAAMASDIALVIDHDGRITDVAAGSRAMRGMAQGWIGASWAETATDDTRHKVADLFAEVESGSVSRVRQINHRAPAGSDVAISYAAIRLGEDGPVLAVGRDLRAVSAIQERFADAQREIERDYWRRRQTELRSRQLLLLASDAVFVVDPATLEIVAANRAAHALFGDPLGASMQQALSRVTDSMTIDALEDQLHAARSSGRALMMNLHADAASADIELSITPLGGGDHASLLVRASRRSQARSLVDSLQRASNPAVHSRANPRPHGAGYAPAPAPFGDAAPSSAFAIIDSAGRLQLADVAFLGLCQADELHSVAGHPLGDLLAASVGLVERMVAAVKLQGLWQGGEATLLGVRGRRTAVEIDAVLVDDEDQLRIGIEVRPVRVAHDPESVVGEEALARALARTVAERASIEATGSRGASGDVSLAKVVQRVAVLAERALIADALVRADHDVARAASMLGLDAVELHRRLEAERFEPAVLRPSPGALN